jgi:myo-inositol-1(or 4)-monophosphatase
VNAPSPAPGPTVDDLAPIAAVVRSAGDRSLRWYRRLDRTDAIDDKAEGPARFDPVTEADRAVEVALREELTRRFPGHAVLGEEFGESGSGPHRWIIDPIDGTRAFITGQPMWGTLLGYTFEGQPVAGWLHLPVLGETFVGHPASGTARLWTAEQWEGADEATATPDLERGSAVSVSATERLDEAVVLCTHPTMFAPGPEADRFEALAERVRMVRYSGDCLNYGLLAMGLADLVVENQLAPYDIVPLLPIIEGAGGIVTDLDGRPPTAGGYVVAAATEPLHRAALDILGS